MRTTAVRINFSIVKLSSTFSTEALLSIDAMTYDLEHSVNNGLMLPGKSSFLHLLTTTLLGSTLVYKKIMVVRHLILYFMLPPSAFQVRIVICCGLPTD